MDLVLSLLVVVLMVAWLSFQAAGLASRRRATEPHMGNCEAPATIAPRDGFFGLDAMMQLSKQ